MMNNTKQTANRILLGRRGESMVVVVALLLVFFILGASALSAASAATAGASARNIDRQTDVYAASVLAALDASLRSPEGGLGAHMVGSMLTGLIESGEETFSISADAPEATLTPAVGLEIAGENPLAGLAVSDVAIRYEGTAAATLKNSGGDVLEANVRFSNVRLTFSIAYLEQAQNLEAVYSYSGWASRASADTAWTIDGTWSVQTIR